ncbi:MAG: asparagine synthetase [Candidatus Heimdallarchaeota archaeon]|nr:MAG: asparagine synthetase [Candidatus Heimdallarchaeota archaeon]
MTTNLNQESEISTFQTSDQIETTLRVQTEVLKSIHDFLYRKSLIQLMPVILSPITDPLCHPVYNTQIDYLGQKFQLTKSMIFHKQIAIATLDVNGIYIMSPNIRLELSDLKCSGKHLTEFTQLDIELKGATAREFMSLTEELMIHIFRRVEKFCHDEFPDIKVPRKPFSIYNSWDLREEYGNEFGSEISSLEDDLFWITDFEREFYDKEDPDRKGHYINYDLYYPEGFGEALSGGERDYEYETLVRKIKERNQDCNHFEPYLRFAKQGKLVPSAGGGLGIERLIRFLTKKKHIREISLFPKVPGEKIEF